MRSYEELFGTATILVQAAPGVAPPGADAAGGAAPAESTQAAGAVNPQIPTHPVRINGIEFDALIEETRSFESEVPQYSVETGFSVSDSIILNQETLSMTLYLTNTPVTWYEQHGRTLDRVTNVCRQLEELYLSRQTVTIEAGAETYKDMAITSLELKKTADTGYSREIPISFKQIRVTTAAVTTIPEEYARAGKTQKKSGSGGSGGKGGGKGSGGTEIPDAGSIVQQEMSSATSGAKAGASGGSILWNLTYGRK